MDTYGIVKALHIASVISWMAGMLYLPRLFVYHAGVAPGSEASETFKVMERRLFRSIMTPAMIATFGFGIWMIVLVPSFLSDGWLHAKLALVLGMAGAHGVFARWRRDFERDDNRHGQKTYRIVNEVPAVLMLIIVFLVVLKPF